MISFRSLQTCLLVGNVRSVKVRLVNCGRIHFSNGAQAGHIQMPVRKRNIGGTGWFLLSVPIVTFGLGVWQINRKKWKEELIYNLMVKTKLPPVPLPEEESEIRDLEYRTVQVKGEFDHSQEFYLGPRSCLTDGENKQNQGTLLSKGDTGYLVVTPFILSDTKEKILVNRGWVPIKKKKPETRREGQIDGEVEVTGILRTTEPRPQFIPVNKPNVRVWFSRDVEAMAQSVGARPVFIDATVDTTVNGGPIGGQTKAHLRNEHFSYIITWFSLSAATSVMWYFRYLK